MSWLKTNPYLIAALHTLSNVPQASRSLPISANNFNGRLDERSAACKLRL